MPPRAPSSEAGRAKPGARELERQLGKSLRKASFRNGPDLDDLPDEVREAMTVRLVRDVEEVLDLALAPAA